MKARGKSAARKPSGRKTPVTLRGRAVSPIAFRRAIACTRFLARSKTARAALDAPSSAARVVADYIAGMTDRFAGREHERLTGCKLL